MPAQHSEASQGAIGQRRVGFDFLLKPERLFLIRAVALMALLCGLYYYPYDEGGAVNGAIDAYLRLQTWGAGKLIAIFEPAIQVHDRMIGGRFPVQIVKSCSSLDAQGLFAATVLAFPAPWWTKAAGLLAGVSGMTLLNLGRIAALYFVGSHAPASFDAVHEEVFPLLLVAFACLGFALWARWARTTGAAADTRADP